MPRQSRKREGRRDTGPIRGVARGSNLAARSKKVESSGGNATHFSMVPKRRKAPRSFGNRRSSRGGGGRGPRPCRCNEGSLQLLARQRCGDPGARGNVRGGKLARYTVSPSLGRPRPAPAAEAKAPVARAARRHQPAERARKRSRGPRKRNGSRARWVRRQCASTGETGAPPPEFAGEDGTLERVCPCVVSCVAEVGRRCLAQRCVSAVLF